MKLNLKEALRLLKDEVIKTDDDMRADKNRWLLHCLTVGESAGIIAKNLGIDEDYAASLGYIHDIGRKISHPNHPIEGYKYMREHGYEEEASICLTHSFIDNDIHLIADGDLEEGPLKEFFKEYFANREVTIYDNIVQMCDLMCLSGYVTTLEHRMLDIYSRKGIHDNTLDHYEAAINLKKRLEGMLGKSLYDILPVRDEDLKLRDSDDATIRGMISAYLKKEHSNNKM